MVLSAFLLRAIIDKLGDSSSRSIYAVISFRLAVNYYTNTNNSTLIRCNKISPKLLLHLLLRSTSFLKTEYFVSRYGKLLLTLKKV